MKLRVSEWMEAYFKRHGQWVSAHPYLVIALTFMATVLGGVGLMNFHWEANAIKLWIPSNSDFTKDFNYLWNNHPPEMRFHSVLFTTNTGENMLQPKYFRQMYEVRKAIDAIQLPDNTTWQDYCERLPVVKISFSALIKAKRRRRSISEEGNNHDVDNSFFGADFDDNFDETDPSVDLYPEPYCSVVESMDTACFETNILELWGFAGGYDQKSDQLMANLQQEEILEAINNKNISGIFLIEKNFKELLGGVEYDEGGRIISAKSVLMNFVGRMNGTAARNGNLDIDNALGEWVDPATLDFEAQLIHLLNNQDLFTDGFVSYSHVARSFSDIASANIFTDVNMVVLGFAIVFIYVLIMLGNFDCVENRVFVSLAGLVAVFMALIASYGICCTLGFPFSPLHNFIPFLILGLGIDDMFVIMQAWNKFAEHRKDLTKVEKFGETLQRAGVSITVTSLTDFLAFAIGASTLLPALKSFCMYCGIGILITYVLQATWFVAWMSIDQDRIDSGRTLLCTSQNSASAQHVSRCLKKVDKNLLQGAFDSYGKVLSRNVYVKVGILSLTAVILAFSTWNTWLLEQKFDPVWFLPKDSYLFQWFELKSQYYPSQGETVHVFMTDLDLPDEFPKIKSVAEAISSQQDIISHVDSWALQFTNYVSQFEDANLITSDTGLFQRRLTQFLFSPSGSKYRLLFHYSEPVQCGKPSPNISMSIFEFTHRLLEGPSEQIPAMNRIKAIIREANFSGHVFPFSKGYATWETDEVITHELIRNLALALTCILLTTLLLLSNIMAALQVLLCVIVTLINVSGFMNLWGLTIDTVSCTILIISIGLCVDFSAHIAHAFLHAQGTRNQRIQESLTNIGPAVLNGGFSTFLSFILLFNSNSHVFDTFFKVFFLVVVFGLFNGLAFLPTLLSLIGPSSVTGSSTSLDERQQDQPSSALSKPSEPESISLEPSIKTCSMPKSAKNAEGLPLEELLEPLNPPTHSTSSSSV